MKGNLCPGQRSFLASTRAVRMAASCDLVGVDSFFADTLSDESRRKYRNVLPALVPVMGLLGRVRYLGTVHKRVGRQDATVAEELARIGEIREQCLPAERPALDGIESYVQDHLTHLLANAVLRATIHVRGLAAIEAVAARLTSLNRWEFVSAWAEHLIYRWTAVDGAEVESEVTPLPTGLQVTHHVRRSMGCTRIAFASFPERTGRHSVVPAWSQGTDAVVRDIASINTACAFRTFSHVTNDDVQFVAEWARKNAEERPSPCWAAFQGMHDDCALDEAGVVAPTVDIEAFAAELPLTMPEATPVTSVTVRRNKRFIQKRTSDDARDILWVYTLQCDWTAPTLGEAEIASCTREPDCCAVVLDVQHFRFSLMKGRQRHGELLVAVPLLVAIQTLHEVLGAKACLRPVGRTMNEHYAFAYLLRASPDKIDRVVRRATRMATLIQGGAEPEEEAAAAEPPPQHVPTPPELAPAAPAPQRTQLNAQRLRSIMRRTWGVAFSFPQLAKAKPVGTRVLSESSMKKLIARGQTTSAHTTPSPSIRYRLRGHA